MHVKREINLMCGELATTRFDVRMFLFICKEKWRTMETSCDDGMTRSPLVESVMLMALWMAVRVWTHGNDG